ncbi:MAG TPA: transporter substrate-binding domain-containing protein [Burkholderiales bacterium]|nr:transporter substrate-binding domain-containing protein [Burkholderiales bacterium]
MSNAKSQLAPSGTLRVGVNHGNFLLVQKNPDGSIRGIVADLAAELGKRIGAPVEFIHYPGAGQLADSASSGAWDVGFLGAEPQRAQEIQFTTAYLEIPATYLVPAGSAIRKLEDVDRKGVRIAVASKAAYDLYLTRNIKNATLVRADGGIQGSYDLFVREKLDALAGLKARLLSDVEALPGSRILEGQFTSVQQAVGTPKGHGGADYLHEFVADIKKSGFVGRTIEKHGIRGVSAAA